MRKASSRQWRTQQAEVQCCTLYSSRKEGLVGEVMIKGSCDRGHEMLELCFPWKFSCFLPEISFLVHPYLRSFSFQLQCSFLWSFFTFSISVVHYYFLYLFFSVPFIDSFTRDHWQASSDVSHLKPNV